MKAWRYILVACFSLFPLVATASTCNVDPSGEFKISFNINSAQLVESVMAEQESGNNRPEYTIWTNDINEPTVGDTPFIRDPSYMVVGGDYSVQLIYQPGSGNNVGTADYYVDDGMGFTFLGNYPADFKGIHPQSVDINSGDSTDLVCDSSDIEPPPVYSNDAQYEFGIVQCSGGECKISLTQSYTNTPLVFVMPTIDSSAPDADAPATLMVTEVSKTEATIEQVKAPKNGGGSDLDSQPITEVSYLAIEPGVADFNGHQVIAGYLNTDAASAKSGSNSNDRVLYSDFGGVGFSSNPVVLHQIQTRNNHDKWMTSGKVGRTDETSYIDLFLELSASHSSNDDYEDEKIAFLATLPTNSNLEVDGYKVQFARGYDTPSQSGNDPMLDGCEDKYATTSLNHIDGIIANKQERAGGHGGWLRRCNINTNQVSFVVDEDFRDRTHIPEEVGYFAFEVNDISLDICEIFPAPAISWKDNSQVTFNSSPSFPSDETVKYFIGGWGGEYCSPSETDCQNIRMGFDHLTDNSRYSYTCQTGRCTTGGEKVDDTNFRSINFPSLSGDVVFNNARPDEIDHTGSCEAALVGDVCHPVGQGDGVIDINTDLNSLTLNHNGSTYPIEYRFPDNKTVYIGTLLSNSENITLSVGANSYHYFRNLTLNSRNNTIKVNSKSTIVIKDSLAFNSPVEVSNDYATDDLIFYGPNADATLKVASGTVVNAHLLFDSIRLNEGGAIGGSVVTNDLTINHANTVIFGQNSCYSSPVRYQLSLTPNKDFSLLCEKPQVTVTVTDTQGNSPTQPVEVTMTIPNDITVSDVIEGNNNGGNSYLTNSSGVLILELDTATIGTYTIEAELASDSTQNDAGDFLVSLYKFEASDVYAVAGQSANFDLTVLACKDATATPVSSYRGDKTLSISDFSLVQPTSAQGAFDGNLQVKSEGDWSDSSVVFNFSSSAQATGSIIYNESGSVSFKLSDPTFECPDGYDCQDDTGGAWEALEGVVNVYVRPWKVAICDVKQTSAPTNLNPATTTGAPGFMASGESFSVTYRPIIFGSGDECHLDVTANYALDSGPIDVSFELAYPDIIDNNLNITPPNVGPFSGSSELVVSNYVWDDVGSVEFKTSATYLTMVLDEDAQVIGRFYPKYFLTTGTPVWDYPGSDESEQRFAYMNQPFDGVEFQVEALNALGNAIENYASFDTTLTAGFSLFEPNFIDRFHSPVPNKVWAATSDHRSIGTFTLSQSSPSTNCDSELCLEKLSTANNYEDGPYNGANGHSTDISITHTGSVSDDPVAYRNEEGDRDPQRLTEQPDIRFGRVNLDSVGGNTGAELAIPLRTEYWNGSRFIVNDDDSATRVDASTSASDVIWSEDDGSPTTVALSDGGQISDGESRNLTASQGEDVSIREQVQLWQSMDDTPWLRYYWNSDKVPDVSGEQDPSTVVTFGIYRGNDRVIYRGESGLTGQ
ncbi:DUF6701 domain-containing protein [uncultured Vibrio sp.]|uniref:DUF6701 domain-containing protein n=1 Tax=uncultured Vibrio sp. TaxID=114054 RepID=UPI002614A0FD|nr:DUF6701 domain-containing protein [uncultured Vibrio sp.]